ncbi:MAG: NUDIX domain-containing protein [Parachlamydiaceae bacterium]|nr:NUDIX domain-containing protein [Parachlamydiaceae bacterium]
MKKSENTNYQITSIEPDFEVLVVENEPLLSLTKMDLATIEQIWNEAQRKSEGSLFNGKLLSVVSLVNGKLIGKFVDYKLYIAQLAAPELEPLLQIKPISISCICLLKEKLLLGKRSYRVTEFPGFYELVPSGGIEPSNVMRGKVNLLGQTLLELEEETPLVRKQVKTVVPFALVQEIDSGRCEVCMEIVLDCDQLNEKLEMASKGEYSELLWVSLEKFKLLTSQKDVECVPFSKQLLQEFLFKKKRK